MQQLVDLSTFHSGYITIQSTGMLKSRDLYLHSTLVILQYDPYWIPNINGAILHSTLVILQLLGHISKALAFPFSTFHSGYITINLFCFYLLNP